MKMTSSRAVDLLIMTFLILGLNLGPVGCASGEKQVATPEQDASRLFEILDVDGDGKISRAEAKSGFQYLIASYDRGGRTEMLGAKPGGTTESTVKRKSKRRPSTQDATRAFEALFENSTKTSNEISKDEFKKMVVKASDNPETDPFVAFY